jgi:hypothetical protein
MRYPVVETTVRGERHLFLRLGPGLFYAEKDGGSVLRDQTSWRKLAGFWINTPWGCVWIRLRRFGKASPR